MRIGVQHTVLEQHGEVAVRDEPRDVRRRHLGVIVLEQLLDALSWLEAHREHALAAQLLDDRRHHDVGSVGKDGLYAVHVAPLVVVVRLAAQHAAELREHPIKAHDREHGVDDRMKQAEHEQVAPDQPLDARVEDLHRDFPAVFERGLVHLRERGGRDRLRSNEAKSRQRALAEGLNEPADDLAEGARGHLVLQLLQVLAIGRRQKSAQHADHLSELDEDAAQSREAGREAPRISGVNAPPALLKTAPAGDPDQQPLQPVRREHAGDQEKGADGT